MKITPAEFEQQLEALEKALGRLKTIRVNTAEEISRIRAVISTWFETLRPVLASQGVEFAQLKAVDEPLSQCMELTLTRSPRNRYRSHIHQAARVFKRQIILHLSTRTANPPLDASTQMIVEKLSQLSPHLAVSYRQVHRDLTDNTRLSYRGTANELREILRETLEHLAPDDKVMAREWYRPVGDRRAPTHQQRARYILEKRGGGSSEQEVVNRALSVVEDGIAKLVRDLYSRAADAAHTPKDASEIERLLHHFHALVHDLCE